MTKNVPTYGFPNFVKSFIEDDKTYKGYIKEPTNIFSNIKKLTPFPTEQYPSALEIIDLSNL